MIPDKAKRRPSRRRSQKWFGNLASDFHFKPLSPSELAIKHPSAQRWFRAKRRRGIRYRRWHIGEPVASEREFRRFVLWRCEANLHHFRRRGRRPTSRPYM